MSRARDLPIDAHLPEIVAQLRDGSALVLQAETGAGKTTRVPPAIWNSKLSGGGGVLLLEPRRLAARVAASRMASESNERVGGRVGYQVRFEKKRSAQTRILVVTEGILLRYLQDDPFLEKFSVVIFDEFHERNLDSDLALAMVRRVQQETRPDLKIVVMSATLDAESVSRFLGDCPILRCEGRTYPLTISYDERIDDRPLPDRVRDGIEGALVGSTGDLLAFLPGVGEIRRTRERLRASGCDIHELYGALPSDRQESALLPGPRRKIILATNVAETSVTVEGVTCVVDSGFARLPLLDPALGLDRLDLVRISKASADQRAGRAGRTEPGTVRRLWTRRQHEELSAAEEPEIRRVDLAGAALQLLAWGERDLAHFPWFEAPRPELLRRALELLEELGATREGIVANLGRSMSRLPLHPRLARLVLEGAQLGDADRSALLVAFLSEERSFSRGSASHHSDSDLIDRLEGARRGTRDLRPIERVAKQVLREVPRGKRGGTSSDEAILRATLAAYPDRVARRRGSEDRRGQMVGGRGVVLARESAVLDGEFFVCVEIRHRDGPESLVTLASRVEESWLRDVRTTRVLRFDAAKERVEAFQQVFYRDLLLRESPTSIDDPAAAAEVLARHAARDLESALALSTSDVQGFRDRIQFLSAYFPELDLPTWNDEDLVSLLPSICAGKRSFRELRKVPILDFLRGALSRPQQLALDRDAPVRIPVPTGGSRALTYRGTEAPVLAVRIQEMFGLPDTPRVAGGKVPVLLHLLAPNGRPQQVTDDLASFWQNTYSVVRKELRVRYPKHAWPEDPLNAKPESRPRRKRK